MKSLENNKKKQQGDKIYLINLVRKGNLDLLPITGSNHQELFVLIRIAQNMLVQIIKAKIKLFHLEQAPNKLIC